MSEDFTKVAKSSKRGAAKGERRGGREAGTPNKKTAAFIDELGNFKSVEELKKVYYSTEDLSIKVQICKIFLEYQYPKRKAIEVTNDVELPVINIKGI